MNVCITGSIWGDMCGSPYEFHSECNPAKVDFNHPRRHATDDTILTLAVAKAILEKRPYQETIFELANRYPKRGFGGNFYRKWIRDKKPEPYNSYGNGSAMRVSPVGWAFNTVDDVLREAKLSAECSHNHPYGIAIAQAVALAIFMARKGQDKAEIRAELEKRFGMEFPDNMKELRLIGKYQGFNETYRSVPPAISAFFLTETFEDCIRQAIALGGDADTQACMAGGIAEAYYGIDPALQKDVVTILDKDDPDHFLSKIYLAFCQKYGVES